MSSKPSLVFQFDLDRAQPLKHGDEYVILVPLVCTISGMGIIKSKSDLPSSQFANKADRSTFTLSHLDYCFIVRLRFNEW